MNAYLLCRNSSSHLQIWKAEGKTDEKLSVVSNLSTCVIFFDCMCGWWFISLFPSLLLLNWLVKMEGGRIREMKILEYRKVVTLNLSSFFIACMIDCRLTLFLIPRCSSLHRISRLAEEITRGRREIFLVVFVILHNCKFTSLFPSQLLVLSSTDVRQRKKKDRWVVKAV